MPAARIRQTKAKRPRIPSEDRTDGPEKRPRNSAESAVSSSPSPNSIHILRDRTRISWQHKGKWRERTPKRTPMSLAQAADDLFTGTSAQGALVNAAFSPQLDTYTVEVASTIHNSSPVSPKDIPIPETPIINQKEEELQGEIARLRSQLEQKDQVISRHENTIEIVQNCVYCPICLDPLWRPFVVVSCGHMACQGCLVSWFTSPLPGHADEPDPPPTKQKRKTCPHCRATVTTRPVEVYGLGGAVAALHPQPPQPPSDVDVPLDPWADIFLPPPARAVRDDADGGIHRCPACFYEIFDGECVGCGRAFSDVSAHTAFGSDDGSVSVFDDDRRSIYGRGGGSLYGGTLYGDEGSDGGSGQSLYEAEVPVFTYPPRARVYDSYDEDEDEDDSFIDDVELPQPPPAAYFNHYAVSDSEEEPDTGYLSARGSRSSPVPVTRANSYTCSSSSSGLSDDEEEDDFLPGRGRRGRSVETEMLPETAEEADDEDDDEEDEASVNPNVAIDIISDDDDDDEPPVRTMTGRSAAERWGGWTPDDGEPPRGRSLSRRRVLSPEDGSEDGSEYFSD